MWQKGEAKSAHAFENSASNCRDRRTDENDVSFDTVSHECIHRFLLMPPQRPFVATLLRWLLCYLFIQCLDRLAEGFVFGG